MAHQVPQYPKPAYYFVNWFKFNDGAFPTIEFRIYDGVKTMTLAEFCDILGVQNVGRTDRINTQPAGLKALYISLCSGDPKEIRRGKISGILFPHIRYFAYYIARGVLARGNTSNISAPDLAILAAALGRDRTYNLGAVIARHLHSNSEKGPNYGGIFATYC